MIVAGRTEREFCFRLGGKENDSSARIGTSGPRCAACGWITDWTWVSEDFMLERASFDVSTTWDCLTIVSSRFRETVPEFDVFHALPNTPGFFSLVPSYTVRFDERVLPLDRQKLCEVCGRWESITTNGSLSWAVRDPVSEESGFAVTDIQLSWHDSRHPLILVAPRVAERLRGARLKGLNLREVPVFS